ncbi:LON peptidase substrate-binding domain-containing protein [Nocardioides sp. CFH 31398]|uniref:LON peptidase substrate-binding domain-containing protein n=1 Tax=Nocardioides sp. CFH 31398 TaxID=2919579 RepID=UPI001F063845|nr:LON peptidase substrate-binding domain-containing protein [Nocardioides sp. CFH 31398]MCH1868295.1 LON peptidase substrate-binding domain-containing protein [Nocardioides sp. CFH 31398]
MTEALPMFPLNSVLFPGARVPLRVFEDRYTALVRHLLTESDPARRLFGSVAIREGFEVGDHGSQSLHRVGCRLQLGDVEETGDGGFTVVATARDRIRLDGLETSGDFPVGQVEVLAENDVAVAPETVERVKSTFTAYRATLAQISGDPYTGRLPHDPVMLSWVLAATAPLPHPDRQRLLEADDVAVRLDMVTDMLRSELRAMNAIPSLPATDVARTGWSPN